MKKLLLLIIILFSFTVGFSQDSRWRLLTDDDTLYDTETYTKDGDIASVWVKFKDYDVTGYVEKTLYEFNCAANKLRRVRSATSDKNGSPVSSSDTPSKWEYSIPDTKGEMFLKIFCKNEPDYQGILNFNKYYDLAEEAKKLTDEGKYIEAIAVYDKIIKEHPKLTNYTIFKKGVVYLKMKNYKESESLILRAIKADPSSLYYHTLGELYEEQDLLIKAKAAFWQSLKLDEDHIFGAWNLEKIMTKTKDVQGLKTLKNYLAANKKK